MDTISEKRLLELAEKIENETYTDEEMLEFQKLFLAYAKEVDKAIDLDTLKDQLTNSFKE